MAAANTQVQTSDLPDMPATSPASYAATNNWRRRCAEPASIREAMRSLSGAIESVCPDPRLALLGRSLMRDHRHRAEY
jgi:hypothetical protein